MIFYFIKTLSGRREKAHIALSQECDAILLRGDYRTICGVTVSPKYWGLRRQLDKARLCGKCRRKLKEL